MSNSSIKSAFERMWQNTTAAIDAKKTSWNELEDRPFGEISVHGDTQIWDGNTDGLVSVMDMLYKVSDAVPTKEDCANGASLSVGGETVTVTGEEVQGLFADDGFLIYEAIAIVPTDNYYWADGDTTFPEAGVYFFNNGSVFVNELVIPNYTGFVKTEIDKLDAKFIDAEWMAVTSKKDDITWDGDTTDKEVFNGYCKISDVVPEQNDYIGAVVTLIERATSEVYLTITGSADNTMFENGVGVIALGEPVIMGLPNAIAQSEGLTGGLYVISNDNIYVSSIVFPEIFDKLPEKYLPEIVFEHTHDEYLTSMPEHTHSEYAVSNNPTFTGAISKGRKSDSTIGTDSVALGKDVIASGKNSYAEGLGAKAIGTESHAEGCYTTASGNRAHAEGWGTVASGNISHAEGDATTASGHYSHAEGDYTIVRGKSAHVQGRYNYAYEPESHDPEEYGTYAHVVGNGTNSNRSDAHTLDWSGNAWFAGDVYVGSNSGRYKDSGSKKLITEKELTAAIEAIPTPDMSSKQDKITGTAGQFVVIGEDGNVTTRTIPYAEDGEF